jgi:hypothetical protein
VLITVDPLPVFVHTMSTRPVNLALRFILELIVAFAFAGIVAVQYGLSYERIPWLAKNQGRCYLFGSQERLMPNSCLSSSATVLWEPSGARRMAR